MKKIDLRNLKVYLSLSKTDYKTNENGEELTDENGNKILNYAIVNDMHKGIANAIYNSMSGLNNLSLAMKLFNSNGEIELADEEIELLKSFAEQNLKVNFLESLNERLNN